jgi:hypothetical protein
MRQREMKWRTRLVFWEISIVVIIDDGSKLFIAYFIIIRMVTVCTESALKHLFNPLCPDQTWQTRVLQLFMIALAAGGATVAHRFYFTPIPIQALESFDQIKHLTHINGVSLDTIERRTQPQTRESFRGFLDPPIKLKDNLLACWQEAEKFRIKHTQIADALDALCLDKRDCNHRFVCNRSFDPRTLTNLAELTQNLVITVRQNMPDAPIQDTDIFRNYWGASKNNSSCEIDIKNPANGITITWTPLRSEFIRKYGFYASKISFMDALCVLTGKTKENLNAELQKRSFNVLGLDVHT